jgi:hypothetical protein
MYNCRAPYFLTCTFAARRVLENLQTAKKARLKTGLIDVDLVRGSTFTKSKTRQGLPALLLSSSLALLFFPIRRRWWIDKTNRVVYLLGMDIP